MVEGLKLSARLILCGSVDRGCKMLFLCRGQRGSPVHLLPLSVECFDASSNVGKMRSSRRSNGCKSVPVGCRRSSTRY